MDKDDIQVLYGEVARMKDLGYRIYPISLQDKTSDHKNLVDIMKTIYGCLDKFEIDFNWMKNNSEILYEQE